MSSSHNETPNDPCHGSIMSRLARRVHGWSWQAFPIGMGTGAVYFTLAGLKNHPARITSLEMFFYFFNIATFLVNICMLLLQGIFYTAQFKRLFCDPVKGVFVPLSALSFATIIIGTINYTSAPASVIYVLFWVYVGLAVFIGFLMLMIWFNQSHAIETFTPAYAFLVFPMMLVGVVAFNALRVLDADDSRALGVLLVGYFFQGLGTFITFFYLVIYLLRLIITGFLDGHQANGAFVACGPPGFTALALVRLGEQAKVILPAHELVSESAGEVWYAGSVLAGLLLFSLAVFLFLFAALPYWFKLHKHLHEILGCWALTFPNVGWISMLRALADIFELPGLNIVHAIMTTLMCLTWGVLIFFTAVAFWRGEILCSTDAAVAQDSGALPDVAPAENSSTATLTHAPLPLPKRDQEKDEAEAESSKSSHRGYYKRPALYDGGRATSMTLV